MANTLANVTYSNETFKANLMLLGTDLVWKNSTKAQECEPTDTNQLYRTELFMQANRGLLNFDIVEAFPKVILKNIGISDFYLDQYASDKNKIPNGFKELAVKEYEKALTSKNSLTGHYAYYDRSSGQYTSVYTEENNYYRMLMGLPDMDDTDYVYNTDPRWSTTTPIHQMLLTSRIEMENNGVLAKLIEEHPDKPYLKFVATKRVDFYKARSAERFEILWRNSSSSEILNKDWDQCYENSRYLTNSVYYSNAFKRSNALYENFLAMCILFMTIGQMCNKYLETDITRDFYDTESLKVVYDSYEVPFYSEIPLEYHRKIVKNINHLISNKGNDEVFLDLFEIFDLGAMQLYNYFLTKRHKLDSSGEHPLFIVKKDENGNVIYDDKGRPVLEDDNYTLAFSRVMMGDDPSLAVSDYANDVDYNIITQPDPYWIEDEDLQKVLTDEDFNYMESKYIGVQIIFDLMKLTYENAFIFREIMDNKDDTSELYFRWTDMELNASVFDLFIYLAAIYCRNFGYEGLISGNIPAVMDTIGYNYEEAIDIINGTILQSDILKDNQELLDLMESMNFDSIEEVNKNYDKILEIQALLIRGFTNAKTIDKFNAYRDLYNSLLVSREVTATYTNPTTGEIFETFTDVLSYYNPELLQRYILLDDADVGDELNLIIARLEESITSMRYLPFSAGVDSSKMIVALFKILKFFKSAKAELLEYKLTYVIRMRGTNFFKMMDRIWRMQNWFYPETYADMVDLVNYMREVTWHRRDVQKYLDEVGDEQSRHYLKDYIKFLTDELWTASEIIYLSQRDNIYFDDFLEKMKEVRHLRDVHQMTDQDKITLVYETIEGARYYGFIIEVLAPFYDKFLPKETRYQTVDFSAQFFDKLYRWIQAPYELQDQIKTLSDLILTASEDYGLAFVDEFVNKDRAWGKIINAPIPDVQTLMDKFFKRIDSYNSIKDSLGEVVDLFWNSFVTSVLDHDQMEKLEDRLLEVVNNYGLYMVGTLLEKDRLSEVLVNFSAKDQNTILKEVFRMVDGGGSSSAGFDDQIRKLVDFMTFCEDLFYSKDRLKMTEKIQSNNINPDPVKDQITELSDSVDHIIEIFGRTKEIEEISKEFVQRFYTKSKFSSTTEMEESVRSYLSGKITSDVVQVVQEITRSLDKTQLSDSINLVSQEKFSTLSLTFHSSDNQTYRDKLWENMRYYFGTFFDLDGRVQDYLYEVVDGTEKYLLA